jgi:hypothetical protein
MSRHVAFITTVHDPEGRLLSILEGHTAQLAAYRAIYAFVTTSTDPRLPAILARCGVFVQDGPSGVPGFGQRTMLELATTAGHTEIFSCDFDRWLHWNDSYPAELTALATRMAHDHPAAWYVCLGRSVRAFNTHPAAQKLPEASTNRAISAVAHTFLDATAGAAWIREPGARLILARTRETSKATDLEWPGLVLACDPSRVEGTLVEGLEFETADGFGPEIERLGSIDAWIQETYDRPAVLRDRLQLASDSISALMRVTGSS